jgi:hypothetical protein
MPPLAALPTAARAARGHVREALPTWGMGHLAGDAEVVVSELVGNAVRASADEHGHPVYVDGQAPLVRVCLLTNGLVLRCEVWDQAPGIPVLLRPADDAETGRGLWTVSELTTTWGWHPAQGRPGKCVWAEWLADRPESPYIP